MNRYNAQILNDKGEYHLQFETDNRENFEQIPTKTQEILQKERLEMEWQINAKIVFTM